MIDFHSHLLPGFDDGAKNEAQLEEMLSLLQTQGVKSVVLTPHFYPHSQRISDFVKERNKRVVETKNVFDKFGFKLHVGAEVYLLDTLLTKENLTQLCIDGGNYIMLEIPFGDANEEQLIKLINKLSVDFDVIPIIAHIDRYPRLFKRQFLEELAEIGCLVQFNIECLENVFIRHRVKKFLSDDLLHLAGSDCHNTTTRRPNFDILQKYLSEQLIHKITSNGKKILK
ncbi:MAG: hypothetical protein IKB86_06680 [Clostridia bacterium]|nr:hypothetical protein [Clostridia bacterium]